MNKINNKKSMLSRLIVNSTAVLLILSYAGVATAQDFHINAGGADFTDANGSLFVADKAFVAGDFGYEGGVARGFGGDVADTTDDALYLNLRGGTSIEYLFDGLDSGDYNITLYFTSPIADTSGTQVFDITVEGILEIDDLDVYSITGSQLVAHTEALTVAVTDGQLNIEFANSGGGSRAMISAISVESAAPPADEPNIDVSPLSFDFGDVDVDATSQTTVSVDNIGTLDLEVSSLTVSDAAFTIVSPIAPFTISPTDPATAVTIEFSPDTEGAFAADLDITSNDPDQNLITVALSGNGGTTVPPETEIHINAGGSDFTDLDGTLFVADKAYVADDFGYSGGNQRNFSGDVTGTTDDSLYTDMRGAGSFQYLFDGIPDGNYDVSMYFTSPTADAGGAITFDVSIEDVVILDDLNVVEASGVQLAAHTESATVAVTDGQLTIDFTATASGSLAMVSAISVVTSTGEPPPPPPPSGEYTFTDVTDIAGLADEDRAGFGISWWDYNNDGWYDMYIANGGLAAFETASLNTFYQNNGDGTFTEVSNTVGGADPWVAMRNVAADFDNDGDQDFYSHNFEQSTLYRNDSFLYVDVNTETGAGVQELRGTGASWGDYDNDGFVDIALTSFPGNNILLRNQGDGTFVNEQDGAELPLAASAMGNAFGDFDNDGDLDLAAGAVTAEDTAILFENNGDGTFTDISTAAGLVLEEGGSLAPVTWADYDNDGFLDLFAGEVILGSTKTDPIRFYLFRNNGDGTFSDETAAAGLSSPAGASEYWDAGFADYDHDGDVDLFICSVGENSFWQNNGDGTFTNIAASMGLDFLGSNTFAGVAFADYDNDNDIDMYLMQHNNGSRDILPNFLFENQGGSNNWLYLNLEGTVSNRDAIGARVTVTAGGQTQIREARAGRGFFSQDSKTIEFGLGVNTTVDSLVISWPSGAETEMLNLSVNQVLDVIEPAQ